MSAARMFDEGVLMSEQHTSPVPMIRLHDGTEIPQVGLGVLRIDDEGVTPVVVD